MKSSVILVLGCVLLCGGCAQTYVMRLTNGQQITTASKPKLKGVYYVYKDPLGRDNFVPQGRVLEILPTKVAQEENSKFKAPARR
jgi:hypothetical protein